MAIKNTIPPEASRVFKGIVFDVWQWDQKMFDGQTQTFEMLKRPNTAQAIAVVGDMILIQMESHPHHTDSFPAIPGGKCEETEEPLITAKRELLEESGYVSDNWILWHEICPQPKMEWTVYTYIARNCRSTKSGTPDAGEKIKTRLVSFDEFLKIATEDPSFYSPEIVPELFRFCLNPERKESFRKLIFNK